MEIHGQVTNGVIVFDDGSPRLPEGTRVAVSELPATPQLTNDVRTRLDFPLVRGGQPGTFHLTNELIEACFEAEELEKLRRSGFDIPS
jgi:hypothetical protein